MVIEKVNESECNLVKTKQALVFKILDFNKVSFKFFY